MKPKISTLLLLFYASLLFSQDINILQNFNGDFEDGITFWRFFEVPDNLGSTWEITNDVVSGTQAMKLTYVDDDGTGLVLIQQMHTHNNASKLNSGSARFENIVISSSPNPQYMIGSGIRGLKLFGSFKRNIQLLIYI